jgi:hypothetical protein
MRRSAVGRIAIRLYYRFGPYLAAVVERSEGLKKVARRALDYIVAYIERSTPLRRDRFRE